MYLATGKLRDKETLPLSLWDRKPSRRKRIRPPQLKWVTNSQTGGQSVLGQLSARISQENFSCKAKGRSQENSQKKTRRKPTAIRPGH